MQNPKFELRPSSNGQFHFVLRAGNGEIILKASETYTTKQACKTGISSVKANAPFDRNYTRNDSPHFTFNLKAENGKVLGNSETYYSSSGRETAIAAVKRDAPVAPVEDLA